MGNSPSECYGAICGDCSKELPFCDDWDQIKKEVIDREVDQVLVYNFLGGQYYRFVDVEPYYYYCPGCFWKPKNDFIKNKQEMAKKQNIGKQFFLWAKQNRKQEARQKVRSFPSTYDYQEGNPASDPVYDLTELLSNEEGKGALAISNVDYANISENVVSMLNEMQPHDEYIDIEWLKIVQTYLFYQFAKRCSFSLKEEQQYFAFFTSIQRNIGDRDHLHLTKTMCELYFSRGLENFHVPSIVDTSLGQSWSTMLFKGSQLDHDKGKWMEKCLSNLISAEVQDKQLLSMITQAPSKSWSSFDRVRFLQKCTELGLSFTDQKYIVHTIQMYQLPYTAVSNAMETGQSASIVRNLNDIIEKETQLTMKDVLDEIRDTKLIQADLLEEVEKIMSQVHEKILNRNNFRIELPEDRSKYLNNAGLARAQSALQSSYGGGGSSLDVGGISDAIATLSCAIRVSKGYTPRVTQLVALIILILSDKKSSSRLLEVMTGEGKSCIIAMFAVVLAVQDKHVDIITSSPLLAQRDSEEWASYYKLFGLSSTHNIMEKREQEMEESSEDFDGDKERLKCYKNDIVYGTVSNFAADVLRQEFEQKKIRSDGDWHRRFDAVIADEVDLLLLDQGVQFTYLSHTAASLHHIEPVLASVWCTVGQYRPVIAEDDSIFYAGRPALFVNAVFESIDTEECELESPSDLLLLAEQAELIDESTVELLITSNDKIMKQIALSKLSIDDIVTFLGLLEPYQFKAYTVNQDGLLKQITSGKREAKEEVQEAGKDKEDEEDIFEVNILLLPNGMACTLLTPEDLKEGATAKVKSSIEFSSAAPDEKEDIKNADDVKLKLPQCLKKFVTHQVPVYVESALRCLQMVENREYTVMYSDDGKDGQIIPVDFENSGMMELSKKWGGGLQQMLEMKHGLSLSSMSVVTNFMSHVELFLRYKKEGAIYGLSGTLGLDSPDTKKVLYDLFEVDVCIIPTHKRKKLYEKHPIIVQGDRHKWFGEIHSAIMEAVQPEDWKQAKGRAVLILCEDIKTATDLQDFMLAKEDWTEKNVKLYARSDSDEIKSIQHTFTSGETVIATNLAGRGTNIKLSDEVKESGGLFCIMTFLPRNRRVELQAFGRTARKGLPGSVQCILQASSLPAHFQNLDLESIRRKRSAEEEDRLDELLSSDVKEVQLKESLFKQHCKFLQEIHKQLGDRDDKDVVLDSLNESWGQWLKMKKKQIENLDTKRLTHELQRFQSELKPTIPTNKSDQVRLPVTNFYHLIKMGNRFLDTPFAKNVERAFQIFTESIEMEPRYAAFAYYGRAYCTIIMSKNGYSYMDEAIRDLKSAEKCLNPYTDEISVVLRCVNMINKVRGEHSQSEKDDSNDFTKQSQIRLQIFDFIKRNIAEAIQKLEKFKSEEAHVIAEPRGVFSLIPDADYITNKELYTLWTLGMEVVFSVKKKPVFSWAALFVTLLGVLEIIGGVLLAVCTVGTMANFGMALIAEGISDCIDGVIGMATGDFSLLEWGIAKAAGLAISLISGGIGKLVSKAASFAGKALKSGVKALKIGTSLGKKVRMFKALPKVIAKASKWGFSMKSNLRTIAKEIGKTVAEEAVMRGVSYGQEALSEKLIMEVGKKCKEDLKDRLKVSLYEGKLGDEFKIMFLQNIPESESSLFWYFEQDNVQVFGT